MSYPPSPFFGVSTLPYVTSLLPATLAKIQPRTIRTIMVAFALLRVSLVLASVLAPAALATPTPTVLTPFGEYPANNVHAVPKGMTV